MAVLTGAVILVGVLCLLDMLMTFGVVRRLRELESLVAQSLASDHVPMGPIPVGDLPAPGKKVDEFTATTVDGAPVSRELLDRSTAVVFMSAACKDCRAQLPELVDWAGKQDRDRVLVVIDASGLDTANLVEPLTPVARVVVEKVGTPVIDAFGVTTFPGSCVVSDGIVIASAAEFTELPALV